MRTNKSYIYIVACGCMLLLPSVARADNCGSFSDCYNTFQVALASLLGLGVFAALLSLLLDFTPFVGTFKGILEGLIGKDLITGEQLAMWQRVLGVVPGGKYLGKIDKIADFIKLNKLSAEAISHINKAEQSLKNLGFKPSKITEIVEAFEPNTLKAIKTTEEITVYRYFDNIEAKTFGRWATTAEIENVADRISNLALVNNSATNVIKIVIPKGSSILSGKVAPQIVNGVKIPGGGNQIYLLDKFDYYFFTNF